jgi:HD-like signal output (HDOD) protein
VEPLLRVAQTFAATPRIMADLAQLLRDPNVELKEITTLLKRDSALAARLLRVANSVAFGQSERVASIDDAASLIGFREIHRLIGAVAVDQFSSYQYPLYGFPGRRLRENALLVALLMEELARSAGEEPPAAYTIGLFRSIGKLALEKLAAEARPIAPFQPERDSDLVIWEKHAFGISGNDATAAILRNWNFPPEIPGTIAAHFAPSDTRGRLTPLLNVAAGLADKLGYGLPGERRYWRETDEVYRAAGIDPHEIKRFVDRALAAFARLNRAIS